MSLDHVVYVDAKAKELEMLLEGRKTMIIRGATGRKLPYGRVFEDKSDISSGVEPQYVMLVYNKVDIYIQ